MKKIAIVGIQGVPAKYGGFETLVENLLANASSDVRYTVFCSAKSHPEKPCSHKGASLKYVPVRANGKSSVLYDILSLIRVIRGYDVVLVLGVSGCIFLPVFHLFYRKKLIINIDGLEYRRAKWGGFSKKFLYLSERMAVRYADIIVADNKGIQDYVLRKYSKEAAFIAYGGDHVLQDVNEDREANILKKYDLAPKDYSLAICRIEPENNCHLILEAFSRNKQPFVFIGNWQRGKYGKSLAEKYCESGNICILNAIYDIEELYILRKNCKSYIHGHSAGGTNPSLVEAMFFGIPVFSFDVIYNRETTENKAHYFISEKDLSDLIAHTTDEENIENGTAMKIIAHKRYTWTKIANLYEQLY